jgi:hypothetical protein
MDRIANIISANYSDVKIIDESTLRFSGTGYIYPLLDDSTTDSVVKFVESGRLGYMIQLELVNELGETTHSSIILHQRYSDSMKTVSIFASSIFYPDCIVRDYYEGDFFERFERLMKGETISEWPGSSKLSESEHKYVIKICRTTT